MLGFGSMLLPHLASAWLQHTDGEPLQIWPLPGHLNTCSAGTNVTRTGWILPATFIQSLS